VVGRETRGGLGREIGRWGGGSGREMDVELGLRETMSGQ